MTIKKLSALLLVVIMAFTFCACGEETNNDVVKVGIVQLVKHDALDKAYEGFVAGLKEAGYSEEAGNIKIDYQVATGKNDECATIANKLVGDKNDVILAIATGAAQAAVNATTEIPIFVTAVTNPEGDCPGPNVSGTSDLGPVSKQVEFAKEICPEIQTLGILYNSSEKNSVFQADLVKKAADAIGLAYKEYTITAATEIASTVESMRNEVQVCWIPTDNTCASNMPTIKSAAEDAGVMTICAESGMVGKGGLVTCGAIDYFELGKQTAAMAVKVIKGEKTVGDLPIEFQQFGDELEVVINTDVAAAFEIPQSVLDKAKKVTTSAE